MIMHTIIIVKKMHTLREMSSTVDATVTQSCDGCERGMDSPTKSSDGLEGEQWGKHQPEQGLGREDCCNPTVVPVEISLSQWRPAGGGALGREEELG